VNEQDEIRNIFKDNFYEARKKLLHEDPFYAHMLYQCGIKCNEEVGTISIQEVDGTCFVVYSEKWVNSLKIPQVVEAIKHVLNHLIYGHLTSELFKEKNDPKMDLAEDLAINTSLDKAKLPPDFHTPSKFNLPDDQSTYEYYNNLPDQGKPPDNGEGEGEGEGKGQGKGEGDGKGKGKGQGKDGDNHHFMTSTVSKSQMQNQTKGMVQQAYKKAGDRPPANQGSGMKKLMHVLLQPAEIPWSTVLRNFVSFSSKVKRESTWKRPNRRYGEEFQGKRKVQTLNVMVCIDESGSVRDDEWKQFLAEIDSIHKTKLATITIVKFTAAVEKVFEYKNIEEVAAERHYGGTNFQPCLDLAATEKPDCLVFLTDGYNSEYDDLHYPRFNSVLFCLTPQGREHKNGKCVFIKKINKEKEMFW